MIRLGKVQEVRPFGASRWLRPLENRRFRGLLLVLAGIPLLLAYLAQTLIQPILDPNFSPKDFWVYQQAAAQMRHGEDIYQPFFTSTTKDPAFNRAYIYPPLVAWAVWPLVPPDCAASEHSKTGAVPISLRGCGHGLDVAQMLFQQLCLVAFMFLMFRELRVRDWQRIGLYAILCADFYAVRINLIGQVNLLLLVLVAVWFVAYRRGDRWWGGAAAGVGVAIKLLTTPLLALDAWRRHPRAVAAGGATVALLWAIPAPSLLPEYLTRVLPALAGGTGFRENESPTGSISRILHPATFYGQDGPSPLDVKLLAWLVAAAVLVAVWWAVRQAPATAEGRGLEASLLLASLPLMLGMQSPSQFVTVLVPILFLLERAFDRRDLRLLSLTGLAWVLLGPVHTSFLYAIAAGVHSEFLLRPWAEMGIVGLALLWWLALGEARAASAA